MSKYQPVTTAGPRAPRLAREREDVVSRTPLHLRERIAWLICYLYEHPRRSHMAAGAAVALLLEHHATTFPWLWSVICAVVAAPAAIWSAVSGVVGWFFA